MLPLWITLLIRMAGFGLLLGGFLAGCATAAMVLCLPPQASPSIFSSPVEGAAPVAIHTDQGTLGPGLYVRYKTRQGPVSVLWTTTGLVSLDLDPDGQQAAWRDAALIDDQGLLRSNPGSQCDWRPWQPRRGTT